MNRLAITILALFCCGAAPREVERQLVAGKPMAKTVSLTPLDSDPIDTNAPDLHFQWTASPNANVTAYALYQGHHYPNWSLKTIWTGTDAWVTNAALYHTEYWLTALAGTNESCPSSFIPQDNGYQFMKLTVTCGGTGTVYRATTAAGPWFRMLINFHGVVSTVTNPPEPSMLYEGPGMKIDHLLWNQ